jgi:hypothetical protein
MFKIVRPLTITTAMLTSSNVTEDDYEVWAVGTAFHTGDRCIVIGTTHSIYEALVNVTGGSSPEVDVLAAVPKWLFVSATNRWKAFDSKVGSQTSQATSITYKLTPGGYFDTLAFLNTEGVSITAVLTDPVDGIVYNKTIDMLTTTVSGADTVRDWYTYFFSSIFMLSDVVKFDVPPYLNSVLDITITFTGGTAKVGTIILGTQTTIGETQYGVGVGIKDYSTVDADAFGVFSVTERDYAKTMSVDIWMDNGAISEIQRLLASYRASFVLWVADENYPCLIILGKFNSFKIVIPYPTHSQCNIEIEGRV